MRDDIGTTDYDRPMKNARAASEGTNDPRVAIIAERLIEARQTAGLTQGEVADQLGRPQSAVSDWERKMRLPGLLELADLMAVYGIGSFDVLLQDVLPAT